MFRFAEPSALTVTALTATAEGSILALTEEATRRYSRTRKGFTTGRELGRPAKSAELIRLVTNLAQMLIIRRT